MAQRAQPSAPARRAVFVYSSKAVSRLTSTRQSCEAVNERGRGGMGGRRGSLRAAAGEEEGGTARQGRTREAH